MSSTKEEANHLNKDPDSLVLEIDERGETGEMKIEKEMNFNTDTFYGNSLSKKNPRRLGNTYAFMYENGEPRIIIGPHWPFYICLSSLISALVFTFFFLMWNYLSGMIITFGILIYLIQFTSYFLTFTKNPGLARKKHNIKIQDVRSIKICGICNVVQYPNEHIVHCYDCNICIEGYDHHCPWTSKCIGRRNLKVFYTFVSTTMVLFGYLIFASATSNRMTSD